jgi:hypothetical protein
MRLPIVAAVALLALGVLGWHSGYAKEAYGKLRCEGGGLLSSILTAKTVSGRDGPRYPPIERIWNSVKPT